MSDPVTDPAIVWADIDVDGDLDITVSGAIAGAPSTRLFENTGGAFADTGLGAAFQQVTKGSLAWADFDADADLDLALTGLAADSTGTFHVYRNEGASFTTLSAVDVVGVERSDAVWGDYDNDGDLDLAMSGRRDTDTGYARVVEWTGTEFINAAAGISRTWDSSLAWGDYDNDGDLDLVFTGELFDTSAPRADLFRNDVLLANSQPTAPTGLASTFGFDSTTFTWLAATDTETPAAGLTYNLRVGTTPGSDDIVSAEADLATGLRAVSMPGNAGLALSWTLDATLPPGSFWSVQAIDGAFAGSPFAAELMTPEYIDLALSVDTTEDTVNLDSTTTVTVTVDHLLGTLAATGLEVTAVVPDGFTLESATPSAGAYSTITGQWTVGTLAAGGTETLDLLLRAESNPGTSDVPFSASIILVNELEADPANNTSVLPLTIRWMISKLTVGATCDYVHWVDFDNDGDLDAHACDIIYRNDAGTFVATSTILTTRGEWGDVDNDGWLDFYSIDLRHVLRNQGDGTFSVYGNTLTEPPAGSGLALFDMDADGDLDVIHTGSVVSGSSNAAVFRNNYPDTSPVFTSLGAFSLSSGLARSFTGWMDVFNTGKSDLLIRSNTYSYADDGFEPGPSLSGVPRTNNFPRRYDFAPLGVDGLPLPLATGNDDDGDPAIAFMGSVENWGLEALDDSGARLGDFDNDGRRDVLLTGELDNGNKTTRLYAFDESIFVREPADMVGVDLSTSAWGDYDGDGDLDALLIGRPSSGQFLYIYENRNSVLNTPPSPPVNVVVTDDGEGTLSITWDDAIDAESIAEELSYDIRVGTGPTLSDLSPTLSNPATGFRRIPREGKTFGNSWSITLPETPMDSVYVSVQAIDAGHLGSAYSPPQVFVVRNLSVSLDDAAAPTAMESPGIVTGTITNLASNADEARVDLTYPSGSVSSVAVSSGSLNGNETRWTVSLGPGESATVDFHVNVGFVADRVNRTFGLDAESTLGGVLIPDDLSAELALVYDPLTNSGASLIGLNFADVEWGDYDGDGDPDLIMCGRQQNGDARTILYRNDAGTLVDSGLAFVGVERGSADWADYDLDGDLDLLLTGRDGTAAPRAVLYQNDGGTFTEVASGIAAVDESAAAWADIDNDGDPDVCIAGINNSVRTTTVYRNDDGTFVDSGISLPGVNLCDLAWADLDDDGDLDLLLAGQGDVDEVAAAFENIDGDLIDRELGLLGASNAAINTFDNNHDSDYDFIISGLSSGVPVANRYRQDGPWSFTTLSGGTGIYEGTYAIADFSHDGRPDVYLSGSDENGDRVAEISVSIWNTIESSVQLIRRSAAAWADYDSDGDVDLMYTGQTSNSRSARIYDTGNTPNTLPTPPTALSVDASGGAVTLSWNQGDDDERSSGNMLTYNVRIGTTPGGNDLMGSESDPVTGALKIPRLGRFSGDGRSFAFAVDPSITEFFWAVQTVDQQLAGSPFSDEQVVSNLPMITEIVDVPADLGGVVSIAWEPPAIMSASSPIEEYVLWRENGAGWDSLATVPAREFDFDYAYVAPTPCDSTAADICYTSYYVSAEFLDGSPGLASPPDLRLFGGEPRADDPIGAPSRGLEPDHAPRRRRRRAGPPHGDRRTGRRGRRRLAHVYRIGPRQPELRPTDHRIRHLADMDVARRPAPNPLHGLRTGRPATGVRHDRARHRVG